MPKTFYGHSEAQQNWLDGFNTGRLHHAWLIVGDKGIGKAALAKKIAKFMLSNPEIGATTLEIDPTSPVAHKVTNKSHPDYFILESELHEEDEATFVDIKVDDVRKLTQFLSLTPVMSKYKIAIIDAVDDMNINAANALLKFLEEPTKNTYFLLVCNSLGAILPTIRSRCRLLNLKRLDFDEFFKALNHSVEIDLSEAKKLYLLTNGSLYFAIKLLEPMNQELMKALENCLEAKPSVAFIQKLAREVADDARFEVFTYALMNLLQMEIKKTSNDALQSRQLEAKLDKYTIIKELLASADKFNLDKSYVAQQALFAL